MVKVILFVLILFLGVSCSEHEGTKPAVTPFLTASQAHLGERMKSLQYFNYKLGLAIKNYNFVLAQFYAQEVKEVADELVGMNVIDEGNEISKLLGSILSPQVDAMSKALAANSIEKIKEQYSNVITSCNACHKATKHDFILIEEPSGNFDGQNFKAISNDTLNEN